ncbi:MAG: radical SAM protein [Dissulfurispiraceae bacterium]|jgi:radical SAM protein with 4Fe4S-binding SPASM domain|nr:radical SAM protein [Dissulfurispiraceae bacterium]
MEHNSIKMPKHLHLNLTQICNLKCRICRPEDYHTTDSLSGEIIDKVIDDTFDHLEQLRIDSAGELLLSKHLPYVLQEATKRNLPIFVSSNGTLMTEEKAELLCSSSMNNIQISIDSPVKETLEWIRRGAKYEDVIQGAKNLVKARKKLNRTDLKIDFHAALLQQNLDHLPDLVRLGKEIGVDCVGFAYGYTHAIMDPEWSVFWIKEKCNKVIAEASALAKELGIGFNGPLSFSTDTYVISAPNRYCHYLYEWSYVQPTGQVLPCCIGTTSMGDLNKNTFKEIWHGEKYNQLRNTYNTPNPLDKKCLGCYITAVWDPEDYRAHFNEAHWDYVEKKLKDIPKIEYKRCVYGEYEFPGKLIEAIVRVVGFIHDKKFDRATEEVEKTINVCQDSIDLYDLYAECLIKSGDDKRAAVLLERMVQRVPQNIRAINIWTGIEIRRQNFNKGLTLIKQALAINPNDPAANKNLVLLKQSIESAQREINK